MVTLAAWVGAWIERRSIRLAPSTISGYRGLLRKYITPSDAGSLPLDAIAPEDLVVLLSPIVAAGHTRAAQLCQVVVGAALRDAVRQRVIPWSPMDCVDRIQHKPRLTAWLTPDQAARLLRCAREAGDPFMSLGCWGCAAASGAASCWACSGMTSTLRAAGCMCGASACAWMGKCWRRRQRPWAGRRSIALAPELADQLRFLRRDARVVPATPDTLQGALDAACRRAGVPRITLHGLRHSMAAVAATEGVTIKVLQGIMGHAHYETTADVYAHVDTKAAASAARTVAARLEIV